MELQFEQTKADVFALNRRICLRRRISWFLIALYSIIAAYLMRAAGPAAMLGWAAAAFILTAALIFGLSLLVAYLRLSPRKYAAFLGPRRFRIDETGIEVESDDVQSKLGWRSVLKVARTKSHWFLFMSPLHALIVPRRAFRSDDERLQFENLIQMHTGGKA